MKILQNLLNHVATQTIPVREIRIGAHWTAVSTRGCGLASTIPDPHPHTAPSIREAGLLTEKDAIELTNLALSEHLMEASVGMATINSLIQIDAAEWSELNAFDILASRGAGQNIAIVGHFPFVSKLRDVAQNLWIIEKRPHPGDLEADKAAEILPQCQVVGITSTSLINHTLESLLALCHGAFVMLIGPTTPLTPILFDYGVDAISGSRVVDEEQVLRYVSQGATFQQLHRHGVKLLTMTK